MVDHFVEKKIRLSEGHFLSTVFISEFTVQTHFTGRHRQEISGIFSRASPSTAVVRNTEMLIWTWSRWWSYISLLIFTTSLQNGRKKKVGGILSNILFFMDSFYSVVFFFPLPCLCPLSLYPVQTLHYLFISPLVNQLSNLVDILPYISSWSLRLMKGELALSEITVAQE